MRISSLLFSSVAAVLLTVATASAQVCVGPACVGVGPRYEQPRPYGYDYDRRNDRRDDRWDRRNDRRDDRWDRRESRPPWGRW